ncbi:hypothetical protein [Halopenitus malekzadehii]|uniref:hypothetical protein n=1 Tax=Halopenitus malekzadehii TaxID=1267564 RepID=UPI0015A4FEB7|nr:hypothetical protein [Halopenitus malekzadehii]
MTGDTGSGTIESPDRTAIEATAGEPRVIEPPVAAEPTRRTDPPWTEGVLVLETE